MKSGLFAVMWLVACSKSAAPEQTQQPSGSAPPPVAIDAAVAQAKIVEVDAAVAEVAGPAKPPEPPPSPPPVRRPTTPEEDAAAFADKLTVDDPRGTSMGDMSSRRPGTDLGKQIDDVKSGGGNVVIGGGSGRGTRSDARISVAEKHAADESTLSADMVLAKIQRDYMAGIKRCYAAELQKDTTLRGKLALAFTVTETGRTVNGTASGLANVDSCARNLIATWRFPMPKDKDGEPVEAAFKIVLQLVPN